MLPLYDGVLLEQSLIINRTRNDEPKTSRIKELSRVAYLISRAIFLMTLFYFKFRKCLTLLAAALATPVLMESYVSVDVEKNS